MKEWSDVRIGIKIWGAIFCPAVLIALVVTASAHAGTYVIDNCPSAPGGNGNAGAWTVFESPQAAQGSCAGSVGSYIGPLGGEMSRDSNTGVRIDTPAGSGITIHEAEIWWAVAQSTSGAHTYAVVSAGNGTSSSTFWQSFPPIDYFSTPLTLQPPSTTTELTLDSYCSADDYSYGCTLGGAENPILQLFGAQLTLEDNSLPSGSVTGGGLAGPGPVSGEQALTYTASDPNSGIQAVDLLVDGEQVAQNDYSPQCPHQSFLACPATVSDSIDWNTTTASAGNHEVALKIVSAASDTAIVDDHTVTISNSDSDSLTGGNSASGGDAMTQSAPPSSSSTSPSPSNGTNASSQAVLTAHWTRTSGSTLTTRYGEDKRITGHLTTSSGQPIVGASIDAYETPTDAGAHTQTLASPHTGPSGEWSLTLPSDIPSSSLRFAYRSHLTDSTPVTTTALTLRVHVGLALQIAPRVTRVGHRIYFSGVVHGPIPPGGKQLILEASSGGEWIQFDTVRTNAQGQYRASYRFKFPGPVTYRFRVVSPFESGFPFLGGVSNGVVVREL